MSILHAEHYDERYLLRRSEWSEAYFAFAEIFRARFGPCRVVDVGCAAGHLVEALRQSGFEAFGVDGSPAAPSLWPPAYSASYQLADLTVLGTTLPSTDLVCCMEVAEHLPEASARALVALLVAQAPRWVVFTAAPPGAALDPTHVNEQSYSWWVDRFAEVGYRVDQGLSCGIRVPLRQHGGVPHWYIRNLLCFIPRGSELRTDARAWIAAERRFLEMEWLEIQFMKRLDLVRVETHLDDMASIICPGY